MEHTNWSRNQANDLKDFFGRDLIVGQLVCKPTNAGRSAIPEIRRVVEIKNGKVFLNPSEYTDAAGVTHYGKITAINYTGRLVILAQPNEVYPPANPLTM